MKANLFIRANDSLSGALLRSI